jgi:hypothetical protein
LREERRTDPRKPKKRQRNNRQASSQFRQKLGGGFSRGSHFDSAHCALSFLTFVPSQEPDAPVTGHVAFCGRSRAESDTKSRLQTCKQTKTHRPGGFCIPLPPRSIPQ